MNFEALAAVRGVLDLRTQVRRTDLVLFLTMMQPFEP